eukprot:1665896-Pyramimonas_sp.AAC.1
MPSLRKRNERGDGVEMKSSISQWRSMGNVVPGGQCVDPGSIGTNRVSAMLDRTLRNPRLGRPWDC